MRKKQTSNIDDFDDIPEVTEAMFKKARPAKEVLEKTLGKKKAAKLLSGKAKVRPIKKTQITIRLDADILEELRASGRGWQTRLNDIIRAGLHTH